MKGPRRRPIARFLPDARLGDPDKAFEYRLARDLGGMTVREMRRRMSNAEFVEWTAFYRREALEREKAEKKARARQGRR